MAVQYDYTVYFDQKINNYCFGNIHNRKTLCTCSSCFISTVTMYKPLLN